MSSSTFNEPSVKVIWPRKPPPPSSQPPLLPTPTSLPPHNSTPPSPPVNGVFQGTRQVCMKSLNFKSALLQRTGENDLRRSNEEDEWTLVQRKKKSFPGNISIPEDMHSFIQRKLLDLSHQKMCFRCFSPFHFKAKCNKSIKCLYCNAQGSPCQ